METNLALHLLGMKAFSPGVHKTHCLCSFSLRQRWDPGTGEPSGTAEGRHRQAATEQGQPWLGALSAVSDFNFLCPCVQHTTVQLEGTKIPLCERSSLGGGQRQNL